MRPLSESSSGFLPSESFDQTDIKYSRHGGCFVSYAKFGMFAFGTILVIVIMGVLMYSIVSARNSAWSLSNEEIEKELKQDMDALKSSSHKQSSHVYPIYYRLKILPYLNNEENENATFSGQVSIILQANSAGVKLIELDSKNLTIIDHLVTITTIKIETPKSMVLDSYHKKAALVSLSQVAEMNDTVPEVEPITETSKLNQEITEATTEKNVTEAGAIENSPVNKTEETNQISTDETLHDSTPPINTPESEEPKDTTVHLTSIETMRIWKQEVDVPNGKYIIHLERALKPHINYTLKIPFLGNLSDTMEGFYKINYKDNGENQQLAATYFAPSSARKAFPCFDDIRKKAKFEISIGRQEHLKSLSNMQLKEVEPMQDQPGWVWDHYQISPPIPTYMVSYIVFNFTNVTTTVEGIPVTIWTRSDISSQANYALNTAKNLLTYYKSLLGTSIASPKLDIVTLPYFPNSGLENWGLIFTSELFLPTENNNANKLIGLNTLGRLIAHQWFGNLVSFEEWDDMWFNEGIVTYLAFQGLKSIDPGSKDLSLRIISKLHSDVSVIDNTYLLSNVELRQDHIKCILEDSYNTKGAHSIRMLSYILSEPVLMKGLQLFFNKWQSKNAHENDLWDTLTDSLKSSNVSVNSSLPENVTLKEVVVQWAHKMGVPVLTFTKNDSVKEITLSQEGPSDRFWYIPLNFSAVSATETIPWKSDTKISWLTDISTKINTSSLNDTDFLTNLNRDIRELVYINYDTHSWNLVHESISTSLDPYGQALTIDDAFQLAKSGVINYSIPLNLSTLLSNNTQALPILTFISNIKTIDEYLRDTSIYGQFQDYILGILSPYFDNSEGNGISSNLQGIFTQQVYSTVCHFEYQKCLSWAKGEFQKFMDKPDTNPIPLEHRFTVYCTATKFGSKNEWNFLWTQAELSSNDQLEYYTILEALACSKDAWILNRYLDYSIDPKKVRLQDTAVIWKSFTSSNTAANVLLNYMHSNWNEIYSRLKEKDSLLIDLLYKSLEQMTTKEQLREVYTLYESNRNDLKMFPNLISLIIEKIKSNISWKTKHQECLRTWLNSQ